MWLPAWDVITQKLFELLFIGVLVLLIECRLKRTLFEHQVRFSKLHETRAEVIAELYRLLVEAQRGLGALGALVQSTKPSRALKMLTDAGSKVTAFSGYFDTHRLYLPKYLCDQLERLDARFRRVLNDYLISQAYDHTMDADAFDHMNCAFDTVTKQIPPIKQDIENEFRLILGGKDGKEKRRS